MSEKLWTCPDCAFSFDAMHVPTDGAMTCPCCREAKQDAEIANLTEKLAEVERERERWERSSKAVTKDYTRERRAKEEAIEELDEARNDLSNAEDVIARYEQTYCAEHMKAPLGVTCVVCRAEAAEGKLRALREVVKAHPTDALMKISAELAKGEG